MNNLMTVFFLSLWCFVSLPTVAFSSNPESKPDPTAKSAWVYPGKDGKLIYKTTPAGDKIMDFSHAGYMGGGVALPVVPVKKTVKPTGAADATETIQSAISEVASLPMVAGFRGGDTT